MASLGGAANGRSGRGPSEKYVSVHFTEKLLLTPPPGALGGLGLARWRPIGKAGRKETLPIVALKHQQLLFGRPQSPSQCV